MKIKKNIKSISLSIFTLILFIFNNLVLAQKIDIIQDKKIDLLVSKHILYNENHQTIPGYRIQIYFDSGNNSKNKAILTKNEFNNKYKDIEAYIIYQEPNYKIRVGNFRTRFEAQGFLNKLLKDYPNAFIVKGEINFPKLMDE
jgi:hypothetical protein